MSQSLFQSILQQDLPAVQQALINGQDVNVKDEHGWAPLHYATELGDTSMVYLLIEAGADVNAQNSSGYTPIQIMMICENYSLELATLLIHGGSGVGSELHRAIFLQDIPTVERLSGDAHLLQSSDMIGNSPLHVAVATNQRQIVVILLNAGADVNARDDHDTTPAVEAASAGLLDILQVLRDFRANFEIVDYNGRTPIIFSSGNDQIEATRMLVEYGVNLNIQDNFGNTPLHYAYENELFEIARFLLENGANSLLKNKEGQVPEALTPHYS